MLDLEHPFDLGGLLWHTTSSVPLDDFVCVLSKMSRIRFRDYVHDLFACLMLSDLVPQSITTIFPDEITLNSNS
jgi:hypothetical protein